MWITHPFLTLARLLSMLVLATVLLSTQAQNIPKANDLDLSTLRAILKQPDDQIDFAKAKLTLDRMIDPRIDIKSNLKRLDAITEKIRAMLPPNASSLQKMETLVQYLYKAGPWNDNQPYQYDLNDPFGHNVHNKLLPTYLTTRKGNCVSMPALFVILGKRLGLDVTLSTAPEHVFVKYRLDDGQFRNFEAVSGGPKLDTSYRRDMPMTDQALANGLYLKPLSNKEAVVVMSDTLSQLYNQRNQYERRIALADLSLEYYPKNVASMLHKSAAYYDIAKRDFMSKYPRPIDIPFEERSYFSELTRNHHLWIDKAEGLGWREPSAESNANYLQTVQRAKSNQ
jgi:regulator of sirC expression with transglutaminase-like and TPR domain